MRSMPAPNSVGSAPQDPALRLFPVPGTALFFFRNARVLGADGVVISPDNRVFAEFTYVDEPGGIDSHSVFRRRRFPRSRPLPGWYATLCYPSSSAYYHWIVESLPRLRLLEPHLAALDGVFVPGYMASSMRESLLMLGVRESQLIPLDMSSHFAPQHLLVPKYCAGLDIPDWVPRYLRDKVFAGRPPCVPNRRVYVSRADTGRRRVTNEKALVPILERWGFEIVRPRDLGFAEQAELFRACRVVVGATGAGLANAIFCQPGAALLTLQPSAEVGPHVFYSLAGAAGLEYWDLAGHPTENAGDCAPEHADFEVDPVALEQTIAAILHGSKEPLRE